jgi:diacylglycerol kinase (ATP)
MNPASNCKEKIVMERVSPRLQRVRETLQLPGRQLSPTTLVLLCGLPGTGKSVLARKLAERLPIVVVAGDPVRHLLFSPPTYAPEESDIVHRTLLEVATDLLRSEHSVLIDATNLYHHQRQRYYSLAEEQGAQLVIVQTTAAPEIVRRRLAERWAGRGANSSSDADWTVYLDCADKVEPIRRPHRVVDTSEDIADVVEEIARQIEGSPISLPPHPRARFILNPAAGQSYRLADLEETLGYLVRQGWELSLRETSRSQEAMQIAHQSTEEGLDIVVAVGGDGTIGEVANGLAHTQTALAVIPLGSGNGWAREQGLDLEPLEAARSLAQGQIRYADLGLAGTRYFLLMAGIGFDAAVVQALSNEDVRVPWPLDYFIKSITMAIDFSGEQAAITLDDRQVKGETILVVISNTRAYGALGQVNPQASVDDGLLDICILRGRGGLPQISLFTLGALFQHPEIVSGVDLYRAREVAIDSETPLYVQTDGDLLGMTPMTFKAVPRALRVLVPRELPPGLFSHP